MDEQPAQDDDDCLALRPCVVGEKSDSIQKALLSSL